MSITVMPAMVKCVDTDLILAPACFEARDDRLLVSFRAERLHAVDRYGVAGITRQILRGAVEFSLVFKKPSGRAC